MKFTLKPGETIETLTPGELSDLLAGVADRFTSTPDETYTNPSQPASGTVNANGSTSWVIAQAPPGYQIRLAWVVIDSPNFTPAAPFTAAGAFISLHRDDANTTRIDFTPSTAIIPVRFNYGTLDAPLLRSGQQLIANVVGGAGLANVPISGYVQGQLEPVRQVIQTAPPRGFR